MAYSVAGKIRIRLLTNPDTGVDTIVDITLPYEEAETSADPQNKEVTVNAVSGTRFTPVRFKAEWSVTFPWTDAAVATTQNILKSGNIISFELCRNPAALPAAQIFEVVTYTTCGKRSAPNKVDDVTRLTTVGEGGDYYPEQVGRVGLPGVFATA